MNKAVVCLGLGACLGLAAGLQVLVRAQTPPARNQGSGAGYQMLQNLEAKARAALKDGNTRSAASHASELLKKNADKSSWNYGNVVYEANQILGLAALKEGRVAAAKQYLLAAGKTRGSPQLDSFGPEMTLAQELLKKGEKQVVLDFLDLVARFWATPKAGMPAQFAGLYKQHAAKIQQWKNDIQAGRQPSLNRFDF